MHSLLPNQYQVSQICRWTEMENIDINFLLKARHSCQQLTLLPRLALTGRASAGRSKLLVADWSEEDVSEWLVEEGLQGLVDKFRTNNIDGTELLSLTKETLASELHIGEEDKHHTLLFIRSLRQHQGLPF